MATYDVVVVVDVDVVKLKLMKSRKEEKWREREDDAKPFQDMRLKGHVTDIYP